MAPFVGDERREIADRLAVLYDQILEDSTPRLVCLVAEGGWGKTRIMQEFYAWLQRERQPRGTYWPPKLSEPEQDPMRSRKVIYPEQVVAPADQSMPWLWWGLRCEQMSSGRKLRALLNDGVQLKAHLGELIEIAEKRGENRDLALSILGETMAFIPGVGQIASIAMTTQSLLPKAWKRFADAFGASQDRRQLEQEPRSIDLGATSAPEVNLLVELVKQFVSPELPLVLAIDDAHAADPDTVEFTRRVLALKAPVLVVCTAWPSTIEDQLDEERDLDPAQRVTFGGLLDALRSERPETVTRLDLSPLPEGALAELVTAAAPNTEEERLRSLIEASGGNPLVLRLNLTSPRVQRSIVDGAITLSPSELRQLPRGFERIIGERFEDLAEADQSWLAEAAMQGPEFLPTYLSSPVDGLDRERIGAFVRFPREEEQKVGRFIEPAVHQAILKEAENLLSESEKEEWERGTLGALKGKPLESPDQEAGGRVWCKLLLRLAEANADAASADAALVSRAAYQLSFIERDLGLHREELSAAESAMRWAEKEPDPSIRALRAARWAAALQANNEPETSVRKAEQATALIETAEDADSSDLVTVMYVLARSYLQDRNPRAARDIALRARNVAKNVTDQITSLEVVAEAQRDLDDLPGGRAALTEALEIARGIDSPDPETVLRLEIELSQMIPYFGAVDPWEEHLKTAEAELGTDHPYYAYCLVQIVYRHLFAGDLEGGSEALAKLEALPGYEPDSLIEALKNMLAGGDLSGLQEAFSELTEAPYSSRETTALFSQMKELTGSSPLGEEVLGGPYDFLRRVSIDAPTALEWLLDQLRENSDGWDEEERLFAVQTGAVHLGEHLLTVGVPSPVSSELLEKIQGILGESSGSFPLLVTQMLSGYTDAMAVLEGEDVPPVDDAMPPLLQVRSLAQRAVAASLRGEREQAEAMVEDAYSRVERLGTWPSLRLVLAAAERCGSPLAAKAWAAVPELKFGTDAERWEAYAELGRWLFGKKRFKEAESFERQVLEERNSAHGPDDHRTVKAKSSLALTLLDSGRPEEARDLYRETLDGQEKILGDEHPLIISRRRNLVRALRALGEFEEALPIQEQVLATAGDPPPLADEEVMAEILEQLAKAEAAAPFRERLLDRWIAEFGEDNEGTLQTKAELVENLCSRGNHEEAYPLATDLVEGRLRTEGADAPSTRMAKLLLAYVCRGDSKATEAITLEREVVDSRTQTLGPTHPLTLEAKSLLGNTLFAEGEFEAAREVEGEVLNAREHEATEALAQTALAASNLSLTLAKIEGQQEDALRMLGMAVEELRRLIGEQHPETARNLDLLVQMYLEAGKPDLARDAADRSLQALRQELGPEHPAVAAAAERLASIK